MEVQYNGRLYRCQNYWRLMRDLLADGYMITFQQRESDGKYFCWLKSGSGPDSHGEFRSLFGSLADATSALAPNPEEG